MFHIKPLIVLCVNSGGRDRLACWPPAVSRLMAGWWFVQQIHRMRFASVRQPADGHYTSWTVRKQSRIVKSNTVRSLVLVTVLFVFSPRSSPLHHHTLQVRPSEPTSGHSVFRPQHKAVGPVGPEDHRIHRQVTNTKDTTSNL